MKTTIWEILQQKKNLLEFNFDSAIKISFRISCLYKNFHHFIKKKNIRKNISKSLLVLELTETTIFRLFFK